MATLDDLFREIRPLAAECSVLTLRRAIRTAARRFCKESKAWQLTVSSFQLTADAQNQDFSSILPTGACIHEILSMSIVGNKEILRSSPQELSSFDPDWRNKSSAFPTYCYRASPTEIAFSYKPSSAISVDALLTLMPLQDAVDLDNDFLEDYWDGLASGALSIALNMPKAPWYDPGLVVAYTAAFEQAILDAKKLSLHDRSPKSSTCAYGGI